MDGQGVAGPGHNLDKKGGGVQHVLDLPLEECGPLLKILLQSFPPDPERQNAVRPFPDEVDQGVTDHPFDRHRNFTAETKRLRGLKRAPAVDAEQIKQ